jgi:hypothetical protein
VERKIVTPLPGESRASYIKRWRTKQKQLADFMEGMTRAKQRTLDEWNKASTD